MTTLSDITVLIRGGGEMASGVSWRLHQCGFRTFIIETNQPLAVRRKVSFCEAVYDGRMIVEGVEALLIKHPDDRFRVWAEGKIPMLTDPDCKSRQTIKTGNNGLSSSQKKRLGYNMFPGDERKLLG